MDVAPAPDDPSGLADLAGGRQLVYLTFGTVFNQPERMRTVLEAVSGLDLSILVTVGPDGDPTALGPQPSNVRIERYLSHALVFRHCDAVVSHGGSGTVLGAASHGIPQLCLPQAADQFLNAEACAHSGIGLALLPDQASPAAIAGALERLLAESGFRDRAGTVAAELAAMPSPEEVVVTIETLVQSRHRPN